MGEQRVREVASGAANKKEGGIKKRKRLKRKIPVANVFVQSTYNNTIVTVADLNGKVAAWSSSGAIGFKGAKKSTPYAAQKVVESVLEKLSDVGLKEVKIYIKGIGSGREAAARAFGAAGIGINLIKDITPIPHNGCRPKKPRRV